MSRSSRASTEGSELVGAVVRGADKRPGFGARRSIVCEQLFRRVPSLGGLTWLITIGVVGGVLVLPAASLGQGDASSRAQTRVRLVRQSSRSGPGTAQHADAPLFALGSGYFSSRGSEAVRVLQRRLADAGFSPGPIDGRYGPRTEQAVMSLQAAYGLQIDGITGPRTMSALTAPIPTLYPGAGLESGGSAVVRVLQRRLADAGFSPGPIDGRYGPRTELAVRRFQGEHRLRVDGIGGPTTLALVSAQRRPLQGSVRPTGEPRSRPPVAPQRAIPRQVVLASHPAGVSGLLWLLLGVAVALGLLAIGARRVRPQWVANGLRSRAPRTRRDRRAALNKGAQVQATLQNEAQGSGRGAQEARIVTGQVTQPARGVESAAGAGAGSPGVEQLVEQGAGGVQPFGRRNDPEAAFNIGVLLEEQGDKVGALAAYRRADEDGHGPAASNLGVLLEEQGEIAGAQAAYARADQRGDANGAFNLGVLLDEQGDTAGALAAYRRADERGHGPAACNLGVLLETHGDVDGAEAAYRRADQRDDGRGAFNLGVLLEEQGDLAGAQMAFRQAGERGCPEVASSALALDEPPHPTRQERR